MKKIVIFGIGSFGEVADLYFSKDDTYEVVAFCVSDNSPICDSEEFNGRPVFQFSKILEKFNNDDVGIFVAVGYRSMNLIRKKFALEFKRAGYGLVSYVHPSVELWDNTQVGENVFIFENNTIQPFCSIGDGVIIWSGNHIGHHTTLEDWSFLTSECTVSGHCVVGINSFLGVNCTIADGVNLAPRSLIGPGALISKNTKPDEAWFADRAKLFPKPSSIFLK